MKIIQAREEHVGTIVELWIQLNDYQAGIDRVHRLKDDAGIGFEQYVREKLTSEEDLFSYPGKQNMVQKADSGRFESC